MRGDGNPIWLSEEPLVYDGPFRRNVQSFLRHFGENVNIEHPLIQAWTIRVEQRFGSSSSLALHVYKETTDISNPTVCDQCRIIGERGIAGGRAVSTFKGFISRIKLCMLTGWQEHPVCTERFHFIFPSSPGSAPVLQWPHEVQNKATGDSQADDAPFSAPASVLDSNAHLLHGVLHLNGFGHLLRINGVEGGSTSWTGKKSSSICSSICRYS